MKQRWLECLSLLIIGLGTSAEVRAHTIEQAIANWEAESGAVLTRSVRARFLTNYAAAESQVKAKHPRVTDADLEFYRDIVIAEHLQCLKKSTVPPDVTEFLMATVSGKSQVVRGDPTPRGTLRIVSSPLGTSVRLDSEPMRSAALYVVEAGKHDIVIEKTGYDACRIAIEVSARQERLVKCTLQLAPAQTQARP